MRNNQVARLAASLQSSLPEQHNSTAPSGGRETLIARGLMAALLVSLLMTGGLANADKPAIDPSYVDGKIYYMIGPHVIVDAIDTKPQLYAQSQELYIVAYPINNASDNDTLPQTLPSGYQPLCNPCYHPGLPGVFAYHDHVLTGGPGLGRNGTAGEFKGPWKIIVLMYNPAVLTTAFKPVTSVEELDAAEAAGMFLPIGNDPTNQYEIDTGNVLICPLVAPDA